MARRSTSRATASRLLLIPGTPGVLRGAASLLLLTLASALPVSCGEATPQCVPGQSIACASSGCTGYQVCSADGKSYDECVCSEVDGRFPAAGPNSGLIGAACSNAASCRPGLECVDSHSKLINGEGPSAGMCLARCLPEHDFCKGLDARSKCIVLHDGGTAADAIDDVAYCLPGCLLGEQANELDKCRGRVDLVCSEAAAGAGAGYCRPACRSDVDCAGRACNLKTGLCSDTTPTGDDIGADCDPSGSASCAGSCIPHSLSFSECSGLCSFGTPGCGQSKTDQPLDYFCYLDPAIASDSGAGDLGYCAKLCDCDADCERADAVCEPHPTLQPKTDRAGVCGSKTFSTGAPRKNTPC